MAWLRQAGSASAQKWVDQSQQALIFACPAVLSTNYFVRVVEFTLVLILTPIITAAPGTASTAAQAGQTVFILLRILSLAKKAQHSCQRLRRQSAFFSWAVATETSQRSSNFLIKRVKYI